MNNTTLPMKFKDEKLTEELRKFDLLEVIKHDFTPFELLMLNEIRKEYQTLTQIYTDEGTYRLYNYASLKKRYGKYINLDHIVTRAKNKLEERGFIATKKVSGNCPKLGYCKIAIKLNREKLREVLY